MVRGAISGNFIHSLAYMMRSYQGGKLSLPVDPAALVYSYFKNVSGIPAPEGSSGVTISKLNILDVLIEQMSSIKKPAVPVHGPASINERIDAMIENYISQIREARLANTGTPYVQPPKSPEGTLFNFAV